MQSMMKTEHRAGARQESANSNLVLLIQSCYRV
jgi:hypothetical protein